MWNICCLLIRHPLEFWLTRKIEYTPVICRYWCNEKYTLENNVSAYSISECCFLIGLVWFLTMISFSGLSLIEHNFNFSFESIFFPVQWWWCFILSFFSVLFHFIYGVTFYLNTNKNGIFLGWLWNQNKSSNDRCWWCSLIATRPFVYFQILRVKCY